MRVALLSLLLLAGCGDPAPQIVEVEVSGPIEPEPLPPEPPTFTEQSVLDALNGWQPKPLGTLNGLSCSIIHTDWQVCFQVDSGHVQRVVLAVPLDHFEVSSVEFREIETEQKVNQVISVLNAIAAETDRGLLSQLPTIQSAMLFAFLKSPDFRFTRKGDTQALSLVTREFSGSPHLVAEFSNHP